MFMDAISWILYRGTEHREFDDSLKWIAEFLKYPCGFTTQDEKDWFDGLCNDFHVNLTGRPTVIIWDAARACQVCWDIASKDRCSQKMEVWTL